jgi:hypothetical protein
MIDILNNKEINRIFNLTTCRVKITLLAGFGGLNRSYDAVLSSISAAGVTIYPKIGGQQAGELFFEWRETVSIEEYKHG